MDTNGSNEPTAVRVVLAGDEPVFIPGANAFDVWGEGELIVNCNDRTVAAVARGEWVYAMLVFPEGTGHE